MSAATRSPGVAPGSAAALFPPTLRGDFELTDRHVATEPPEAGRVSARDGVRMMVSPGDGPPRHTTFRDLPAWLQPGDVLVVNTSATIPAAIDASTSGRPLVIHVSTELPGGLWMVEPRTLLPNGSTEPLTLEPGPHRALVGGGVQIELLRPAAGSQRLWLAVFEGGGRSEAHDRAAVLDVLARFGRPIRYRYVPRDWPLACYQTVFANRPGSAEMPSAARPFTAALVAELIGRGIALATITLHTGVSSLEGHELPYPERYEVPPYTAATINEAHAEGRHVIAVGTTVVRALETVTDGRGIVHPATGWTDVVISPERRVRSVDGLLSGWHEPQASHLAMLEAVAGRPALGLAYDAALEHGYRWHEFGDSHLLLPYAGGR